MFCQQCGTAIQGSPNFCPKCGKQIRPPHATNTANSAQASHTAGNPYQGGAAGFANTPPNASTTMSSNSAYCAPTIHDVPRCTCCGYTGKWKVEAFMRPYHIVLTVVLFICGIFPGIIYLSSVIANRAGKGRRAKICPQCKARNLWTFTY